VPYIHGSITVCLGRPLPVPHRPVRQNRMHQNFRSSWRFRDCRPHLFVGHNPGSMFFYTSRPGLTAALSYVCDAVYLCPRSAQYGKSHALDLQELRELLHGLCNCRPLIFGERPASMTRLSLPDLRFTYTWARRNLTLFLSEEGLLMRNCTERFRRPDSHRGQALPGEMVHRKARHALNYLHSARILRPYHDLL
jgi:hypothetical protein